jgi:arsenate reductase
MTKEKITVYEKPTCTKCREVRKVLTEKGVEFEAINYFEQPLTPEALGRLLRVAGLKPLDAMRKNEPAYRDLVAGKQLKDEELVWLMAGHPELIQRPIVVRGKRAVIARPVEKLDELEL